MTTMKAKAWAAVLDPLARMLTHGWNDADRVTVIAQTMQFPAAVHRRVIYMNFDKIERDIEAHDRWNAESSSVALSAKGLLLHEVGHILFSPSTDGPLSQAVKAAGYWTAYNALEDQRMEALVVARYEGARPWLEAALLVHLVAPAFRNGNLAGTWPLVAARAHVSQGVRRAAREAGRDRFGHDKAERIEQICRQYVTIPVHDEWQDGVVRRQAWALIEELGKILQSLNEDIPEPGNEYSDECATDAGKSVTDDEQQRVAESQEQDSTEMGDEQSDSSSGDSGEQSEEQGGEQGDNEQNDSQDNEQSRTSSLDGSNDDGDDACIEDAINDALRKDNDETADAVNEMVEQHAVERETVSKYDPLPKFKQSNEFGAHNHYHDPSPEAGIASRRIVVELDRERDALRPGWIAGDAGRLNGRRFITQSVSGRKPVDVRDRFDAGALQEAAVELAILIDLSRSMMDPYAHSYSTGFRAKLPDALNAMWAVKRAADDLAVPCGIYGFHRTGVELYAPDERIPRTCFRYPNPGPATAPGQALEAARIQMTKSNRAIKLVVVVTDGEWTDEGLSDGVVLTLNRVATTILVGIDGAVRYYGHHHCHEAIDVESANDLVNVVRTAMKTATRKVRHTR